jgi:hypothetical protein
MRAGTSSLRLPVFSRFNQDLGWADRIAHIQEFEPGGVSRMDPLFLPSRLSEYDEVRKRRNFVC